MALIFEITIEPYFDSDGVYDKNSFIDYNFIYM